MAREDLAEVSKTADNNIARLTGVYVYAKLFTSIYQGTLRGNSHGLLVFTNLLAHADMAGRVDIHPRAIAEEVGLTVDEVKATLLVLESPDDESRSPEEQGRRIVRLDEHRAWGWLIVNYVKYRSIRNEDDRREQNRRSQAAWRAKQKDKIQSVSEVSSVSHDKPPSAHTEAEAEAKKEVPTVLVAKGDAYRPPAFKIQDLVDAYHELCPSMPRVRVMTNMRQKHAKCRWVEVCVKDSATEEEAFEFFRWYFSRAEASDFLTGRRGNKDRLWRADFEWLMTAGNFAKVIEGKYHEARA